MDGIRSSSGGSGCLLTVRPAGEFRPGERHPRGARGGRRGARAPGPGLGDLARGLAGAEAPARWAGGGRGGGRGRSRGGRLRPAGRGAYQETS